MFLCLNVVPLNALVQWQPDFPPKTKNKTKNKQKLNSEMCSLGQLEAVPLAEFMYLVFTRVPGENYRRRLRFLLLYLCYVFRALINSLVCWLFTQRKILSGETILSTTTWTRAHIHTGTCTHEYILSGIHNLSYSQLKQITNRDLRQKKKIADNLVFYLLTYCCYAIHIVPYLNCQRSSTKQCNDRLS